MYICSISLKAIQNISKKILESSESSEELLEDLNLESRYWDFEQKKFVEPETPVLADNEFNLVRKAQKKRPIGL